MSKEFRIGEVSPMLKRLEKIKCKASEEEKPDIEKIENMFQDVGGLIFGLQICEKEIVRALEVTTRDVDKILEDNVKNYSKEITDPKEEFLKKALEKANNIEKDPGKGEDAEEKVAKGFKTEQARSAKSIIESICKHVHGDEDFEKIRSSILKESSKHSPEPPSSGEASASGGKILAAVDRPLNLEELFRKSPAMLSYIKEAFNALDIQVKRCMFCICLFPENSNIKKRLLVYCWIGAGYVGPTGDRTAEQNGHAYFEELVAKCLVQPIYKSHSVVPDGCSLPSLIRKIVMSAATRYRFSTKNVNDIAEGFDESDQAQPKMMFNIDGKKPTFNVTDAEKIRVMHIGMWQSSESHDKQVQHVEMEDTDYLEQLASSGKLRYLSLQGVSRIESLPDSISKQTGLFILDLRACHNLEKLPDAIKGFKRLTHLDVSKCYLLEHVPKGIASLHELQVLKGFVVPNSRSKDPCRLGDLSKLDKLRKLSISIARESNVTKEELDKLNTFRALRSLTITWGSIASDGSPNIPLAKKGTKKSEVTDQEPVSATATEETEISPRKESTVISEATERSVSSTAAEETKVSPSEEITEKSEVIEKSVSAAAAEETTRLHPKEITEKPEMSQKSASATAVDKTKISPPEGLEKLDIRCFPYKDPPEWLNASQLKNLKKLYFRGGKLAKIPGSDSGTTFSPFSGLSVLRFRFLKDLEVTEDKLKLVFPKITYLEIYECAKLNDRAEKMMSEINAHRAADESHTPRTDSSRVEEPAKDEINPHPAAGKSLPPLPDNATMDDKHKLCAANDSPASAPDDPSQV